MPAKTPQPVVNRINEELVKALKQPDVKARFAQIGAEPIGSSPAELAKYLKSETAKWSEIVRARNIKAD